MVCSVEFKNKTKFLRIAPLISFIPIQNGVIGLDPPCTLIITTPANWMFQTYPVHKTNSMLSPYLSPMARAADSNKLHGESQLWSPNLPGGS